MQFNIYVVSTAYIEFITAHNVKHLSQSYIYCVILLRVTVRI